MEQLNGESLNLKPPFSYMNSNTELLNSLSALESNLNSNYVQGLVALPNSGFLDHQHPEFPMTLVDNTQRCLGASDGPFYTPVTHFFPSASSGIGLVADHNNTKTNYDLGTRKRKRNDKKEAKKPREVIHVRAKRGQATDGHSLAERSRREKINKKLRCLQDLVPGCYKTMGMAVMLDVIIDYVRSLQNQIEFLSMKLSAASLFYDFDSEMDTMDTTQGTSGYVAQGMLGEGYGELSYFPSTRPI